MNIYSGLSNLSSATYQIIKNIYPLIMKSGNFCVWLCKDNKEYQSVYREVQIWGEALNVSVYPLALDNPQTPLSLNALFHKYNGVYVVKVDEWALIQQVYSVFATQLISIKKAELETPDELKEKFLVAGYTQNTEEVSGTFKHRGDLFTIYTEQYPEVIRVYFGFDCIEKILLGKEEKNTISLVPVEIVAVSTNKKLQKTFTSNISYIVLNSYLDKDFHKSVEKLKGTVYDLEFLSHKKGTIFDIKHPKTYSRQKIPKFASDLVTYIQQGYFIYIASVDTNVINYIFDRYKIKGRKNIKVIDYTSSQESFISTIDKVLFLTQHDIFGKEYLRLKSTPKRHGEEFLKMLKQGEYITHVDYGIGRYLGITRVQIDGFERENIELEYAKGDKLYLPVDLVHKIDKYIGASKPKINRLSDHSWCYAKRKVSLDVKKIATELIALYAQREIAYTVPFEKEYQQERDLADAFEYNETSDQKRAIGLVLRWLERDRPMDALIVGDVGFGKTEVAIRAAYKAVLNGKQVAFLCPTTILAQQHYDSMMKRFSGLGVNIAILSRFTKKIEGSGKEKEILDKLKMGDIDIIIGTHRLLSKDVQFKDIGLLILDEEQKFGVKHKEKLKEFKHNIHVLTLTATPIPRTLYFSLSGIRDMAIIETPPLGRMAIKNYVGEYDKKIIKDAIEQELKRKGQVYYIHNRVETIAMIPFQLKKIIKRKNVRYGILHGQLPEEEIASVMHAFDLGKIDVLICSSIIENGLDLPNANTLIVTNADKFGLGQLYQFRGRIGRGNRQAFAYFLHKSQKITDIAIKRLRAIEEASALGSGYRVASRDLEIRGMGDLLGRKQHGHIRSVGLNVYTSLLNQSIEDLLKGVELMPLLQEKQGLSVDLPVDYDIPSSVISDENKRLVLYYKLSSFSEISELEVFYKKNLAKYKNKRIDNLYMMLRLKIQANKKGVHDINYIQYEDIRSGVVKQIVITLNNNHSVDLEKIDKRKWKVVGNKIKGELYKLKDVISDVESIIRGDG